MTSFLSVPVDVAYHLVVTLTSVLTPALGGLAAAAGIIIVTIGVRLLIAPLSIRALRGQAAQARLAPQLQALRQRYGKQPERLQRELTALYQREGTSLLAAFWPLLAQWPVLSLLYVLFRSPRLAGGANQLLTHSLLGSPLGSHWLAGPGVLSVQGGIFLGVFAVLAALCWLSVRLAHWLAAVSAPATAKAATAPVPGSGAVRFLGNVLPYLTVVIAAFAPLAAGLYLITTMAWSIGERWFYGRRSAAAVGPKAATSPGKARTPLPGGR